MILLNVLNWRKLLVNCNNMILEMFERTKHGRPLKVAREIRELLSEYLMRNPILDDSGFRPSVIEITFVSVSSSLEHACVSLISSLSEEYSDAECVEYLTRNSARLRRHLAENLRLKTIPQLYFCIDKTFEYAKKIDELCRELDEKRK